MMRIVTHPQLLKDLSLLDPILDSPSWKTLMTVTRERERTRESPLLSQVFFFFWCGAKLAMELMTVLFLISFKSHVAFITFCGIKPRSFS